MPCALTKEEIKALSRKTGIPEAEIERLGSMTPGELIDEVRPFKEITPDEAVAMSAPHRVALERQNSRLQDLKRHAKRFATKFQDLISVTAKFNRGEVHAPKTGSAVKNVFGQRVLHEEKAIQVGSTVARKLAFSKADMFKLPSLIESPELLEALPNVDRIRLEPAIREVNKYFEQSKIEYRDLGVPLNMKSRVTTAINRQISKAISRGEDADVMRQALEDANRFDFSHIPSAVWFENLINRGDARVPVVLSFIKDLKRFRFRVNDLLEAGVLSENDLNIVDIVAEFGRQKGKDFSMVKIANAASEEGLASDTFKEGFGRAPLSASALKGKFIHPTLADWVNDASNRRESQNFVEKGISVVKGAAFYNPLFLGMYDGIQSVMLGSLPSKGMFKNFSKGFKSAFTKDEGYYQAADNGTFSVPFNNPYSSYRDLINSAKTAPGRKVLDVMNPLMPWRAVKAAYNLSWDLAWNIDRGMRMSGYYHLIGRGFTPAQAGRMAARFFGDYASAPPRTRRVLNNFLFTPTFKIGMGKLYTNMVQGVAKEVTRKGDKESRTFALGMVRMGAVLMATDMGMRSLGYEPDEWGVRYKKRVMTPEGPKDHIINPGLGPANLPLKYFERVRRAFKPGVEKPFETFLNANKWEVTPLLRVASEIVANKDPRGNIIYSPFDDGSVKAVKTLKYAITHSFQLLGLLEDRAGFEDPKAKAVMEDEIGQLTALALRPFSFTYLRTPEEISIKNRAERVRARFIQLLKRGEIKADNTQTRNLVKELNEILNEMPDGE